MAQEVVSGPVGEIRGVSTAGGGTALTTTAVFILLPRNTNYITITPRNFSTAVVAQIFKNPWLVILKTTDNMMGQPTDYSDAGQDSDATTDIDISELGAITAGDFLLVGSHYPFGGARCIMDGTNSLGTATLAVSYWDGTTWTAVASLVDGTESTRTFAQSGTVTWTVPSPWPTVKLENLYPHAPKAYYSDMPLHWTRWSVSAALTDTSVTLDNMVAVNRLTTYAELVSGQTWEEKVKCGLGGISCIQARTNAGTANLIVNAACRQEGAFA